MRIVPLLLVAFLVAVPSDQATRSGRGVVGSWRLVGASATRIDGRQIAAPYGPNPTGIITYTADGQNIGVDQSWRKEAVVRRSHLITGNRTGGSVRDLLCVCGTLLGRWRRGDPPRRDLLGPELGEDRP